MKIINIDLMKNPFNWLIILLMLIIFAMFADLVLNHYVDLRDALNPNPVANQ